MTTPFNLRTDVGNVSRLWRPLQLLRLVVSVWLLSAHVVLAGPPQVPTRLAVDAYSDAYDDLFRHYSHQFFGPFMDWRWFKAQAVAESRLNTQAKSEADARGLMQLLPSTYEDIRADRPDWGDIHSPRWNIAAGLYYNRMLFRKWNGHIDGKDRMLLMLASYNAGFYRVWTTYRRVEGVKTWKNIEGGLPRETREYVERIQQLMQPEATTQSVLAMK